MNRLLPNLFGHYLLRRLVKIPLPFAASAQYQLELMFRKARTVEGQQRANISFTFANRIRSGCCTQPCAILLNRSPKSNRQDKIRTRKKHAFQSNCSLMLRNCTKKSVYIYDGEIKLPKTKTNKQTKLRTKT